MLRIFSIPPEAGPDKKRRLIRLLVKIKPDCTRAYSTFSQAEIYNGLKSVHWHLNTGTNLCIPQSQRLDHIFSRGISIPCEKLKYTRGIAMAKVVYFYNPALKQCFCIRGTRYCQSTPLPPFFKRLL